ncbi:MULTISPECIES: alpha/beta fold hydrolase [Pseudonocardia]|uniref:Pyrethroid hydrolase n=2 Tax=Pseudonocardia TaxID=1847 RepID=A0A1Y2N4A9_PSEAH|nr:MULTISPECIES: alpha/beta fold hydrolase [Pseudonocardia]OSY42011.1 Pyrethroid hydrolase [Pseudonocardia autotrophica]TDN75220.1 alpha/beta hydrolase family protein [Pseudonocardia autotrophica]BBF99165.1 alpha/beta hydrolase [Pseudonocardia autotrophica]GEC28582.1 alpha/beta hydrolase [Pseudonocardia saturnea]
MSAAARRTPASAGGTIVLLVHGAWHSSLHWALLQRELTERGIASLALDLPGHGPGSPIPSGYLRPGQPGLGEERSALAAITVADGADVVVGALSAARRNHSRTVVVAHSAGGGAVSLAAEQAPDLLDRIVYLSAFIPAGRPRFTDFITDPVNAGAVRIPTVGDAADLGAHRINPLSPDPAVTEPLRLAFLDEQAPGATEGWRLLLHPDEPFATLSAPVTVTARRWGRVPRSYIRLEDDRALPAATQQLMIDEADRVAPERPCEVHSLAGGHSPFITRPAQLAELITRIAR